MAEIKVEAKTELTEITIMQYGEIRTKRKTTMTPVVEGAAVIELPPHYEVHLPGDVVEDEDPRVKALADMWWTDDVKDKYKARQKELEDMLPKPPNESV